MNAKFSLRLYLSQLLFQSKSFLLCKDENFLVLQIDFLNEKFSAFNQN